MSKNDVDIKVEGLREFIKDAKRAGDKDTPKAVRAANKDAAAIVVKEAKTLVPKRTGRLGASIKAQATQRKGVVSAGKASLPYAGPIHFGWRRHNIEPQPFIYDALDNRRDAVFDAYYKQISDLVERF